MQRLRPAAPASELRLMRRRVCGRRAPSAVRASSSTSTWDLRSREALRLG